jgi:2-oxoglutarate ferredoxin oxidoreductase subunit alpha
VILLSDGYIANGSEPWKLPKIEDLPSFPVKYHTDTKEFLPYSRDAKLARPWAIPGTPGLEHRVGGLEKEHLTGNISYDAENHDFMVKLRAQKVMGVRDSIPTPKVFGPEKAEILVLGWGSTAGTITGAVEKMHKDGVKVARMHLRHVWPLPKGLDAIFSRYKTILVPEMNLGQMVRVLRTEYPHHNFVSYPKVQGQPFRVQEIIDRVKNLMEQ